MENEEELINKTEDKNLDELPVEENQKTSFPIGIVVFIGIVVVLMVVCIILLFAFGGPVSHE